MRLNYFELDEKGIIPLDCEGIDGFEKRGNEILKISGKILNDDLVFGLKCHYPNGFIFSRLKGEEKRKKKVLEHMKRKYGVDLSWVRFLRMHPIEFVIFSRFYSPGGSCVQVQFPRNEVLIGIPYVGVVHHHYLRHELIHVVRSFCLGNYSKESSFEEAIVRSCYIRARFYLRRRYRLYSPIIRQAKKRLKKYFGENYGYVFVRLTCDELFYYIVSGNLLFGNPKDYLLEMSKTSLRHWIMCRKLGLIT